jgi:hypothetical protein
MDILNRRRTVPRWLTGAVVATAAATALIASPAQAAQVGTNFCVNQGHDIYSSATFNSTRVGWVSYYDVWHHYSTSGNWSLGYDRQNGQAGYVPLGILAQDLGNGSTATLCPYH